MQPVFLDSASFRRQMRRCIVGNILIADEFLVDELCNMPTCILDLMTADTIIPMHEHSALIERSLLSLGIDIAVTDELARLRT